MEDPVVQLLLQLKGIKWVAYLMVFVLVIIGIANFTDALRKIHVFSKDVITHYQKIVLSDEELKIQSTLLAEDLMKFVMERNKSNPQFSFDDFEQSTALLIKYSSETNDIYYLNYAAKVSNIRNEFLKRKLSNKDLDNHYKHPTNILGLRNLAVALSMLSHEI